MVNAGRVACITTPFILSLGVLICIILVFLAGTIQHNDTLDDMYFLKIDLKNITLTSSANLIETETLGNLSVLGGALQAAKQSLNMTDYYTIYLRNYCAWNGNDDYAFCSPRQSFFWFDPITIWGLNNTGVATDDFLPKVFRDGLSTYHTLSKVIFVLYSAALAATCLTIAVGFSAIFSRIGSFVTTFFASAAAILVIVASIAATAVFSILREALDKALEDDFGIKSSVGTKVLSVTWIGSAFGIGAGFFWLLSVCCCSGRSPYNPGGKEARRTRAEKTPYTYERVGSPYLGPRDSQAVPLTNLNHQGFAQPSHTHGNAYEPFRPQ